MYQCPTATTATTSSDVYEISIYLRVDKIARGIACYEGPLRGGGSVRIVDCFCFFEFSFFLSFF